MRIRPQSSAWLFFPYCWVSCGLNLIKTDPEKGQKVVAAIHILQVWVMKLVRLIMTFTPYGVFALMAKVVANSKLADILNLGGFLLASYVGLAIMFMVHALILSISGVNPVQFFKKVWPVLSFAFTSRSSAASIPLNIEAQTRRLGVPESIASFSASFGTTIGQNGCLRFISGHACGHGRTYGWD